jgi:hypothetical protein
MNENSKFIGIQKIWAQDELFNKPIEYKDSFYYIVFFFAVQEFLLRKRRYIESWELIQQAFP